MKFMVAWTISRACDRAAGERFLKTGAPDAAGVETTGRWHAPGSAVGWHVVEADASGVAELEAVGGDLLDVPITPVIEDAEAASNLAEVHGKERIEGRVRSPRNVSVSRGGSNLRSRRCFKDSPPSASKMDFRHGSFRRH
jgi:hypothetical protein